MLKYIQDVKNDPHNKPQTEPAQALVALFELLVIRLGLLASTQALVAAISAAFKEYLRSCPAEDVNIVEHLRCTLEDVESQSELANKTALDEILGELGDFQKLVEPCLILVKQRFAEFLPLVARELEQVLSELAATTLQSTPPQAGQAAGISITGKLN